MRGGALEGCRVLDLGIITAGAATSALLADLGAEVIKVESPTYRDPFRAWAGGNDPTGRGIPPLFRATNRNKEAISLDLKHADGRAVFLRLVERSHVVVENFRRGVMERLGLSFAALQDANPDIILASISSQGETGPDAGYVSFGSTLEAAAGLAALTGYPDGAPVISGRDVNYPDQVVAVFAAGMIATAWGAQRAGTGGVHLDLSQRELTSFLVGEAFLSPANEVAPSGNIRSPHLLQDCFRAADDRWVAVTLSREDAARAGDLLAVAPDVSEPALRRAIAAWVRARPGNEAVADLADRGCAAALSLDGAEALAGRSGLWREGVVEAADGAVLKGFPFQLEEAPLTIRRDAPAVGEHTAAVLARVGGYSAAEIAALAKAGIVEVAA